MKTPSPSGKGLGRNAAKLLRKRQWQPTPVLLPGKSHGREEWVFHKEGAALGLPWWLSGEESVWRPQLLKPEHPRAHASQQEKPQQRETFAL